MFNIKGAPILNAMKVLRKMGGEELIQSIYQAMPKNDAKAIFDRPIISISKVPYPSFLQMLITGAQVLNKPIPEFIKEINDKVTEEEFKGILGVFVKILSPQTLLKKLPQIWKQYTDKGIIEMEFTDKNNCICKHSGIDHFPDYHDIDLMSSVEGMLIRCRAKNINVTHLRCVNKGAKACEYHISWE